jgi:hypothetical protein
MKIRRQIVVFDAADLGARLLQPADDPEAAQVFQAYADPAGHPFCLCRAAADA